MLLWPKSTTGFGYQLWYQVLKSTYLPRRVDAMKIDREPKPSYLFVADFMTISIDKMLL